MHVETSTPIDYGRGIYAFDSGYMRPQLAAVHLVREGAHVALIDCGTAHSVPRILRALDALDIAPKQVDYLILTHVHLDHAGGAGALMRELPQARLTVHPRGAAHMADPSKLRQATAAVYGEAEASARYGELLPVARERIVETPEGTQLLLGSRMLRFHETPGHARHHVAIFDQTTGHVFVGDTYGLSYRELDEDDRQFVFPTTSPAHFDPGAYHRSLDRIAAMADEAVYVTHFGQLRCPRGKLGRLHALVDAHAALALAAPPEPQERTAYLLEGVRRLLLDEVTRYGSSLSEESVLRVYGEDVGLNAQGLESWLQARRA